MYEIYELHEISEVLQIPNWERRSTENSSCWHCTLLDYISWYGIVSCCLVWYSVESHGAGRYGVVWCHTVFCYILWYSVSSSYIALRCVLLYSMVWYGIHGIDAMVSMYIITCGMVECYTAL